MALSRVGDAEADPEAVLVVAVEGGQPRGLLQFVPWGTEGLSLDLMVRDPAVTENGLNELLITDLLAACRALDVDRVSLNFAVFRSALERGERIGAGPVARLWARLLRIASRWWQIETLYRFNARFAPDLGAALPGVRRGARPAPHRRRGLRGRGLRGQAARAASSASSLTRLVRALSACVSRDTARDRARTRPTAERGP